jgi:CDP-2,3-bis-(O-geranylgeranyl)-sn-glycerol synthase
MRACGRSRLIHEVLIFQMLMLVAVANGTPVAAKLLLGDRFAYPLDGGSVLADGRPLFGHSKTVRGLVLGVLATILAGVLLGLDWRVGALVGGVALAGDLLSSLIKRRLGLAPSSMALGLDQIPESLFPLLAARLLLPLSALDIAIVVIVFFAGELILSRILFRLNLRDRPY